nr:transmembrane protein 207 isoform X2 [Pelodiscus sinensis]|eukprot:XP_025034241.1 transmembrane protein 207 isoform X2 [Pelodiscus sinensis]
MWRAKVLHLTWLISEIGGLCLTLFQLADCDPKCELDEPCVNYNEEHLSAWYIGLLALLLLAMTLSCGFLFCMQCWLKRRSSFPCRRTLAVFALSDADSLGEASPRAFSGVHTCPPNPELGPSTTPHAIPGGAGPPPSYEDIMKTGKH